MEEPDVRTQLVFRSELAPALVDFTMKPSEIWAGVIRVLHGHELKPYGWRRRIPVWLHSASYPLSGFDQRRSVPDRVEQYLVPVQGPPSRGSEEVRG